MSALNRYGMQSLASLEVKGEEIEKYKYLYQIGRIYCLTGYMVREKEESRLIARGKVWGLQR